MPSKKLTAQGVENAKPLLSGRLELWDTLVPGFGLRVTEKGAKSWVVMYRSNGKQRRLTLDRKYPALSLAEAREEARQALSQVAKGIDPADEKKALKAAPAPDTVETVIREFVRLYARPKNRSWRQAEGIFERHVLPVWGDRPVGSITRRDVIALLYEILDRSGHHMANRTHANLSRFFRWCQERDRLDISPVTNVKAPGVEVARDRILSDDEIEAVWRAWDTMGWPFGAAFKLLLLTGQRRDEVARLEWENVDFEGRLWTLPRTATKSNRLHEVPLSDVALEILAASPRTSQYIFSTNGTSPISGFSHAKRRCDDLSGIHNWRLHDLRRTAASGMAHLGVAPHVVEKVLNHVAGTISGVAAVYNRHGYADEKRAALGLWATKVQEITEGPADNVVPLRR